MNQKGRVGSGIRARAAGVTAFAIGLAVLLAAGEARAAPLHGGCYAPPKMPAKAKGAPGKPAPGGPGIGASTGPGTAGAAGVGPARNGTATAGRNGSATGAPPSTALVPDLWEIWWQDNQDRFLDLRAHLESVEPSSTLRRPLTGQGRAEAPASRRAPAAVVAQDILPVLFDQLGRSDEPEILDSSLIALGRCTPDDQADRLLVAVRPMLAHEVLSVQTSAVLALGIQGSPGFVPLLGALMADTPAGRKAVGGGEVPPPVRSLAALALGLGNHPAGVPMLADFVQHLPDSERELKACALTALGLTRNDAGDQALGVLLELLGDRRLDSPLRAQVPLALACLDDGTRAEAVPALLATLGHPDSDDSVRNSCLVALGRMASFADPVLFERLTQAATKATNEVTRHAALMALAEIGLRDLPEQGAHAGRHAALVALLVDATTGSRSPDDRAWGALATGIYARGGPAGSALLVEALTRTFADQKDPSVRGAFAVALGLAGARQSAPDVANDFVRPGDESLRGYAALALGLLGARDAVDEMLACCASKSTSPGLREQVAVGLALLGARDVVPILLDVLQQVEVHPVSVSVARSLGRIGDAAAIGPLARIVSDASRQPSTRGLACVALGLLGERSQLPWNTGLKELRRDETRVAVLDLVLDIL